ncbi:lysostaphin resistance A-like protein [Capnocytophaga sp. ARDL2]|uniref:CPBP family intramembrane glutamic endopeptidase n=1 Tax=Capnocytophaga sp. ARDL2 TaxID=3238809 RepID=UPI003558AF79
MFLNQVKKDGNSKILYAIGIIAICLFFGANLLASRGMDTADMIATMAKQMGQNMTFFFMLIPFVFLLIGLLIWSILVHKQSITQLITSRENIDFKRIFTAFFTWAVLMICMLGIEYVLDPEKFIIQFDINKFFPLFLIAIILVPIQTTCEELMFRSYMTQGVFALTGVRILAWIIPSVLFGLMHISNPEAQAMGVTVMIYYIGTGLFLGALTLLDEGSELAIGFHAANNLIGSLLVTSSDSVFQVPSVFIYENGLNSTFEIFIPVFVIFPLLLYFFHKRFKFKLSFGKLLSFRG